MKILSSIRRSALILLLLATVVFSSCGEKITYIVQTDAQGEASSPDGQNPEGGEDFADGEIPEPTQKHQYEEPLPLDYTITDLPEFVNDISECSDTQKKYVLPDGYLYECVPTPLYDVTNQLSLATDVDGSLFNGCGYLNQARIRSVLEIGDSDFSFVTGFIPIQKGDTVYFDGYCFDPQHASAHVSYTVFYNAEKQVLSSVPMRTALESTFEVLESAEDGYVSAMKVKEEFVAAEISYVRFTLLGSGENAVLSINEPLIPDHYVDAWVKTEKYISDAWYQEICNITETIRNLESADASSLVKFMFATDIHLDPNPAGSYTENLGKVCAEIMRACDIPFFATGGDNCTQSSEYMPSVFSDNMNTLLSQLSPIPQQNILLTVGNHDGATGWAYDDSGETVYYCFQLNNQERSTVFFDWQRETNPNKKFDTDGTYYYIDDPKTKTRYIVVNSMWSQWEGSADGYVSDIQHNFMVTPMFGPQQLQWFAEEALDMPPEYAAIIITHYAPEAKDFNVFKGIVDAFNNQTVYRGQYIGAEEWQSTRIAVNYENAYGEIIALFQGHKHMDAENDFFDTIPCINVTTTGAYWAVNDENAENRVKGTATEFALDAVVIDRTNRKIYLTRIGAGDDRVISY